MEKERETWLDGYIKSNCKIILEEAIPNKWDCLGILFGREGVGKTTFGVQLCKELDPTFDLDRIVFTPKQFEEACENCEPESAILWDEAITAANAAQHASGVSQSIVSRLTQIRKKKLKIILCFPYLHMLNKYFISRCLFSCYLYAKDFDDRGYGLFYSGNRTEFLYNKMKETYRMNPRQAMSKIKCDFYFKFSGKFLINEDDYDEKKELARKSDDSQPDNKWKNRLGKVLVYIRDDTNGTLTEAAKRLDMTRQNFQDILKEERKQ